MTLTLTLVALVRIVPYALAGLNAWFKGYKWLTLAMIWLIAVAIFNFFVTTSAEVRALFSSAGAFLLLMHALDLQPKRKGGDQ